MLVLFFFASFAMAAQKTDTLTVNRAYWQGNFDIDSDLPNQRKSEQEVLKGAPLWLSIKSNILLDLVAVPELGVDIYFSGRWAVGADFFYAWWSKRDLSRVWHLQGGEIYGRCYFGKKPTSRKGWFAGIYGQILRYDFLLGKSGSLSGGSGTSFFQHPTFGGGIMAGYTLPLNRHFSLDFNLGIGYLTGKYQKYKHTDGLNVWESTLTRQYFGPTKGEISLVWHIWKGGGK